MNKRALFVMPVDYKLMDSCTRGVVTSDKDLVMNPAKLHDACWSPIRNHADTRTRTCTRARSHAHLHAHAVTSPKTLDVGHL